MLIVMIDLWEDLRKKSVSAHKMFVFYSMTVRIDIKIIIEFQDKNKLLYNRLTRISKINIFDIVFSLSVKNFNIQRFLVKRFKSDIIQPWKGLALTIAFFL